MIWFPEVTELAAAVCAEFESTCVEALSESGLFLCVCPILKLADDRCLSVDKRSLVIVF